MITIKVVALNGHPPAEPFSAEFDELGGSIGRGEGNTLVLPDPERHISRTHASITFQNGRYVLQDRGSATPVQVNGHPLGQGRESPITNGDELVIGNTKVRLIHTPGHTPGSQCFLAGSALVSGDTLFIGGCGRVDLPGGNPDDMYHSLTQVLSKLPEDTLLFPGHNYASKPVSTIGDEKKANHYLNMRSLDDWKSLMGAD